MKKIVLAAIVAIVLLTSIAVSYYVLTGTQTKQFTLTVTPEQIKGQSLAGQYIVFLVTVSNVSTQFEASEVKISAVANSSAVLVQPTAISEGQVAEVSVVPSVAAVGKNVTLEVTAQYRGAVQSRVVNFSVARGEDYLSEYARQLRDRFVQWLETAHPELGITNQTQWQGTIVSPVWLVVSHYLFFSKDWEMHVYWHIMIPPYDWARIDLRHRYTELTPSLSFEISSVNSTLTPVQINPPESVWR